MEASFYLLSQLSGTFLLCILTVFARLWASLSLSMLFLPETIIISQIVYAKNRI